MPRPGSLLTILQQTWERVRRIATCVGAASLFEDDRGLFHLWAAVVRQAWEDLQQSLSSTPSPKAIHAALYLASLPFPLPPLARNTVSQVLETRWGIGDVILGALDDWQTQFLEEWPPECMVCGGSVRMWRPVLRPPKAHKNKPWTWRYRLPENHIPLCARCYRARGMKARLPALARGIWGVRFRALEWVHRRAVSNSRFALRWDEERYPLWPPEASVGETWETGCGALECTLPRPPRRVQRSPEDLKEMQAAFQALQEDLVRPVHPPAWVLEILRPLEEGPEVCV